jgi:hypothetical protein
MKSDLPILDSSEQPDTTEGKTMAAQTKMTETEKTIMITVFAGLILVSGWTGIASFLGFNGTVELTNTVSTILAVISAGMVAMMVAGVVVIRKN